MMRQTVLIIIGAALACGMAACGPASSAEDTPGLCPAPQVSGPGTYLGTEGATLPTLRGHVARLRQAGPPLDFEATPHEVEVHRVFYRGTVAGDFVQPDSGRIEELLVAGRSVTLKSQDLRNGCLETVDLGPVRVLFENSLLGEAVTLVLTEAQIENATGAE